MSQKSVSESTNELIADKLADDVEASKAEKYEELQDQFVNDEITEEEFDAALDDLFESGDEFLDHEPEAEPIVDRDEAAFRLREVGQLIGAGSAVGVTLYAIYITNGAVLPLLIPVLLVIAMYKAGAFR